MHIVRTTDILLPNVQDMTAWSVIACDQFTSQREYWDKVIQRAGEAPSTLHMMLPEAWLGTPAAQNAEKRIASVMTQYLDQGLFLEERDCLVYLERTLPDGRTRRGLVAALDLEPFDPSPDSRTPIRPTEGTVSDRVPPRQRIRAASPLEMPHLMVLMDDRENAVLGPLAESVGEMKILYDFDLMLGGGHVTGRRVDGETAEKALAALESLGDMDLQRQKYGAAADNGPMTLAVGDGNHSLAAAKLCWEELRPMLPPAARENHPARFALAEIVNIHDPALDFAPIHRLIRDTDTSAFPREADVHRHEWESALIPLGQRVAAVDAFCRDYTARYGGCVDYIHGDDAARELGSRPGCAAVLLPGVDKDELFKSVLTGGPLPRKSFSMGRARDKRYYLECRKIR